MNTTGRGGFNMRGGVDDPRPLTQDQLDDIRLNTAMHILTRIVDGQLGGERMAESAWNTVMNIACGSVERQPFDIADRDILINMEKTS